MTYTIPTFLITIISSFAQVWAARPPKILVPVSKAVCSSNYTWMNNAEQKDPCLTVAFVLGACAGDSWTQPALPTGYSYNAPNGTTANPCYWYSWSCYNLMMACTLCQSPANTGEILTWPAFSQGCPSNYKNDVFPPGYDLEFNTSIPVWATTDPTTWPYELFNVALAQEYANQNHSYYYPPPSSSLSSSSSSNSKGSNLGAIIGGTVGGAVGLLLILVGGYILYKRRQHRRLRNSNKGTQLLNMGSPTMTHSRWPSEPSTIFPLSLSSGSPPLMSYEGSSFSPPLPPTETASFVTTGNEVVQRTRPIPMV